jgi:hypothetical protein
VSKLPPSHGRCTIGASPPFARPNLTIASARPIATKPVHLFLLAASDTAPISTELLDGIIFCRRDTSLPGLFLTPISPHREITPAFGAKDWSRRRWR